MSTPLDYRNHLSATQDHLLGSQNPDPLLKCSYISPTGYWTSAEKNIFFHALVMHSPDALKNTTHQIVSKLHDSLIKKCNYNAFMLLSLLCPVPSLPIAPEPGGIRTRSSRSLTWAWSHLYSDQSGATSETKLGNERTD
jgi:hypothetical protein